MTKNEVYKIELEKLKKVFEEVEESKGKLVEGLIEDASFLFAENFELRTLMQETGMLKVHPTNRLLQKQTEAAKQYLKNINSYSVIIKTLNGVLMKNVIEEEDEFDNWIKEKMKKDDE